MTATKPIILPLQTRKTPQALAKAATETTVETKMTEMTEMRMVIRAVEVAEEVVVVAVVGVGVAVAQGVRDNRILASNRTITRQLLRRSLGKLVRWTIIPLKMHPRPTANKSKENSKEGVKSTNKVTMEQQILILYRPIINWKTRHLCRRRILR